MTDKGQGFGQATFEAAFAALQPAIVFEWPEVPEAEIQQTAGDLDRLLVLLASKTGRTKVALRRSLEEIFAVIMEPPVRPRVTRKGKDTAAPPEGGWPSSVEDLLAELEQRSASVVRELRRGMFADTKVRIRENLLLSLLIAVGLGFILGGLMHGSSRGK